MTPNDERHGTNAGYCAGCRSECCQRAHMVTLKRYRMNPKTLIPSLGSRRRIEALEAIGWSRARISRELGFTREWVGHILRSEMIRQDSAEAIAGIYDRLSMVIPLDPPSRKVGQTRQHDATRARARRKGYAPPLAWTNIDDPNESPNLGGIDDEIDPVVVDRLLHLEPVTSTRAEKVEAMRRWLAMGRSEASICDALG